MSDDDLNFDSGLYGPHSSTPRNSCRSAEKVITSITIFISTTIDVAVISACTSFLPQYGLEKKDMTVFDVGAIMSAIALSSIIFGGIFGRLLSVIGTRFMIVSGLFLVAGSTAIQSVLSKANGGSAFMITAILCHVIKGIGFVSRSTGVMAMISADFNTRTALYMGLFELASGIGAAVGPLFGGAIYDQFGFEIAFLLPAGLEFFIFFFSFYALQDSTVYNDNRHEQKKSGRNESNAVRTILRYPPFYFPILSVFVALAVTVFFTTTIGIYISDTFHASAWDTGVMLFIFHGNCAVWSPILGWILDKKGYHELSLIAGHIIVAIGLMFLGPVPFFGLKHNYWITVGATIVCSTGALLIFVPSMELCFKVARHLGIENLVSIKSIITSSILLGLNIGSFLGPVVGGMLIDSMGFPSSTMIFSLLSVIVAFANFSWFIYKPFSPPRYTLRHEISVEETQSLIESI